MSLEELKRVVEAQIFKAGRRAGALHRGRGRTTFVYDPQYDGPDVATTLPRNAGPVEAPAGAVPPFFAGLLPEGRRLSVLRRAVKTSSDDELSLLLAVGSDAIGDVQVTPAGSPPQPAARTEPGPAHELRFRELYAQVLSDDPADRVGLPGVQDKLSGGMIALPLAWAGRPSMLKLSPPEYPDIAENEAFFLGLARDCGLAVPDHEVIRDAAGESGLLVARFDRLVTTEGVRLRAQEDGCQVLGLYPADKYLPSCEEVVAALSSVCGAPVVAARDLLRQVSFAYLTCNGDQHAKNLSIVQDDQGEWWPTPAYDLVATHPYGDTTMALSIDGKRKEDIGRSGLLALARHVGVPERAAARVLDQVVAGVGAALDRLDQLPYDPRRIHKLRRAMQWRLQRLGA